MHVSKDVRSGRGKAGSIPRISNLYNMRGPGRKPDAEAVCCGYSWPLERALLLKGLFYVNSLTMNNACFVDISVYPKLALISVVFHPFIQSARVYCMQTY